MKEYKILLVCSGGMSTSVLMNKMEKYAQEKGISLAVDACGTGNYEDEAKDYDIILLGPQIAYRKAQIAGTVNTRSCQSRLRTMRLAMLKTSSRESTRFSGNTTFSTTTKLKNEYMNEQEDVWRSSRSSWKRS